MEQRALSDRNQFPTEEVIYSHLGATKPLWISFFVLILLDILLAAVRVSVLNARLPYVLAMRDSRVGVC